ncbi:hypothetical protein Pmani_033047 [Petrolisthes manimaculis]|uniref:Uncharacterized protein n=1 Tax=Petrolisthes manimaculis TaxID=1843537 RepID=A0AAE1TQF9_9EUCA|nr:hypothetical protein Pmani_033047 [Petrolisthes manimaculis]
MKITSPCGKLPVRGERQAMREAFGVKIPVRGKANSPLRSRGQDSTVLLHVRYTGETSPTIRLVSECCQRRDYTAADHLDNTFTRPTNTQKHKNDDPTKITSRRNLQQTRTLVTGVEELAGNKE